MSKFRSYPLRAPARLLLPALFITSFAQAQTQSDYLPSLPQVLVTANRFAQNLAEEPVRATIITAEDILRSGARTITDVLGFQAGVNIIDASGSPNKQIDLRGFGLSGDQNTLILLDGQRITENELASADLASIPMDSIDRIEVLRGSGAVLFGRGATGGTINIITKKNTGKLNSAAIQMQAGSYGTWGMATSASVASEKLGLSIFADRHDTDNYRINNQSKQENLTATLTYLGDRGPLSLRVSNGAQSLRLPSERSEAQLVSDPRGTRSPNDYADLATTRIALGTEQKFDFGTVAFDLTQRSREAIAFFESYGTPPSLTKVNSTSFSPRIRIPFNLGSSINSMIVGADWDRWTWDYFYDRTDTVPISTAHQQNQALYFRQTADFITGTTVAFGARQQRVLTDANDFGVAGSQSRTANANELAIRQKLNNIFSITAKVGQSFRMQTVDEIRGWTGPLTLLEPQSSREVEAGLVYETTASSFAFNVFRSRINNEIHYYPGAGNVNLPPTQHQGIEIDGKVILSPVLSLSGNAAFTEAKFHSGLVNGIDVTGKDIPLVPKQKFSASALWKFMDRTSLNARATYVGSARLDNDQQNTAAHMRPAFTVADLVLLHERGAWRFRASALNIFDKRYFTYGIRNLSGSSFDAYPAMGRSILMSAEYRF